MIVRVLSTRKVIVAIGGGEIRTRGTASIDREIIRLSGKTHPKLLFIPTASSDSDRYWRRVREYFGEFLGCKTDVLFLMKERPSRQEIRPRSSPPTSSTSAAATPCR